MEDTITTLADFIKQHRITLDVERLTERRDGLMEDMTGASHWRTTLRRPATPGEQLDRISPAMTVTYSMGSAHTAPPTVEDVLDSIASDSSGVITGSPSEFLEFMGFEEWASDYGYDTDSRSAERTYNAVVQQARDLSVFLADDEVYEALLYCVERL